MNKLFAAICALVFLGLLSTQANALICYSGIDSISVTSECNGTNAACMVRFGKKRVVSVYKFFYFFLQKTVSTALGITINTRSCSLACTALSTNILSVSTVVTCCSTDKCNSSQNVMASKSMLAFVSVLAVCLLKMFA